MKNKPMRVMLVIMVVVLIIGIAAVVGYKYMKTVSSSSGKLPTAAQLAQSQYELDKLTTNLSDNAVIQVTFALQADSPQTRAEIEQRKAQVLDLVNNVLHITTREQLAAAGGQQQLKSLIAIKVNGILSQGKVTGVFVENIIVQ